MLKYLGFILTFIAWCFGGVLFLFWRDRSLATISQHAAITRKSHLLFIAVLVGLGLPFYYWLWAWLAPTLNLGIAFTLFVLLAAILQTITAIVPDTSGRSHTIHHYAAYGMGLTFLPIVLLVIFASKTSGAGQWIASICLLYMLITLIVVAVLGKARQHFMIYQTMYIVGMQIAILSVAYLR